MAHMKFQNIYIFKLFTVVPSTYLPRYLENIRSAQLMQYLMSS